MPFCKTAAVMVEVSENQGPCHIDSEEEDPYYKEFKQGTLGFNTPLYLAMPMPVVLVNQNPIA